MRGPKLLKGPFQDEKNERCWSGRGNRICKHQGRKIKTQLEQVALHQKTDIFPVRPEGRRQSWVGVQVALEGGARLNQYPLSTDFRISLGGLVNPQLKEEVLERGGGGV